MSEELYSEAVKDDKHRLLFRGDTILSKDLMDTVNTFLIFVENSKIPVFDYCICLDDKFGDGRVEIVIRSWGLNVNVRHIDGFYVSKFYSPDILSMKYWMKFIVDDFQDFAMSERQKQIKAGRK